jgi:perosamine synthetase
MLFRHLPPVASPVSFRALARATAVAARGETGDVALDRLTQLLREQYRATAVALTDSGTSALVVALRAMLPRGGTVALPAYGCVDLIAAVVRSGVQVRLYDIDPATLGPDLDSLRRAVGRGVDLIVVAPLYGYPVDMASVRDIAAATGALVIEDAAQHAGARVNGVRVGATGPVTVLSFGRGKGTTGGRGGAVFATEAARPEVVSALSTWAEKPATGATTRANGPRAGWTDLGRAAAQWAFGRPALYAIPASIPALGLGQTVYRPAQEPTPLSRAAATLVVCALMRADADRAARVRRSAWYVQRLSSDGGAQLIQPIPGAEPGYLRFPILSARPDVVLPASASPLGVVRTYPRALGEEPAIAAVLKPGESTISTLGAQTLCRRLVTLPTHAAVRDADAERVVRWVGGYPEPVPLTAP